MIRPNFTQSPIVKLLINIGATLDIPTGYYIKGPHGENILLGGLGALTGVVGIGNNFKSTILNFMILSAGDRISSTTETDFNTYDTEINIHEEQLKRFTKRFDSFKDRDIIFDGTWTITDKNIYHGNQYFEKLKDYLISKTNKDSKLEVTTPFLSRDRINRLKIITPTFGIIDSFTEFNTSDVVKMQNENEIGDAGGNTIHMRQGLAKARFLMEAPALVGCSCHFLGLTAHLGKEMAMASGPFAAPPVKKLQYLKNGDKIKGATDRFSFLMNNCWHAFNAAPLINQLTKSVEYPRNSNDNRVGDTDLNIVSLRQLRGKAGPTGFTLDIIVSQVEGVLPSLTEFHFLKTNEKFGISGSNTNYHLDLLPDVNLSRTTVRGKIDNDFKLRRALNITSELLQMHQYYRPMADILCTPQELYDDIKKLGYDWDILLNTRGWWTVNDDNHPLKFLSTKDLIDMRQETYHPWWYPVSKDKLIAIK